MASISKRGDMWLVRITRKGHPQINKSFSTKRDAETFAAITESEIARGVFKRSEDNQATFREALMRYRAGVTPTKRGKVEEDGRIAALLKPDSAACAMLDKRLEALGAQDIAKWRDKRGKAVAPATLMREWAILSHCLETARREWGHTGLANPFKDVRKPVVKGKRIFPSVVTQISPPG